MGVFLKCLWWLRLDNVGWSVRLSSWTFRIDIYICIYIHIYIFIYIQFSNLDESTAAYIHGWEIFWI